jgi:hypothetical protein
MSDAQSYHDSLIEQGYSAQDSVTYTQQHFPDFGAAPAVATEPVAVAEPIAVAAPTVMGLTDAGPGLIEVYLNTCCFLVVGLIGLVTRRKDAEPVMVHSVL